MEDDVPEFASPTEEIAFWKGKAQEWKNAAINSKEELDEFQVQEPGSACCKKWVQALKYTTSYIDSDNCSTFHRSVTKMYFFIKNTPSSPPLQTMLKKVQMLFLLSVWSVDCGAPKVILVFIALFVEENYAILIWTENFFDFSLKVWRVFVLSCWMGQSAEQSRDDFMDVQEVEVLSYQYSRRNFAAKLSSDCLQFQLK